MIFGEKKSHLIGIKKVWDLKHMITTLRGLISNIKIHRAL
jgi:hypothetical protein